ncbi:MAG: anaerobic ribonucleoside-triphosphate reductase activating protein [Peptoniphilaceae bacterium]|nr:anaerobic ribonucleoside-triphosphate reductase activating protein [Peptoniphilaceae bacterium]MDY6085400.1 anaerobic ribonucleoside-triphosphate reductase activating protein [Peptoniphilaceae bacterium]
MNIQGLQEMTLVDVPGHVAATVFLSGCDLRCPYCHNAELWDGDAPAVMDDAAFFDFLERRRGFLDAVCITGGEPLLRADLADFLRGIQDRGYFVKLDTNGTHPEKLAALIDQGLVDSVAMDIKNSPSRYAETAGRAIDVNAIFKSVALLRQKMPQVIFRTTVTGRLHDDESFEEIGQWLAGASLFHLQPFRISAHVPDPTLGEPQSEDLLRYQRILRRTIAQVEIRG